MDKILGFRRAKVGWLGVGLILAIGCAGCASGIKVTHLDEKNLDMPVVGNPWNLAMTQFQVKITREVVNCEPFGVKVVATATPTKALDNQQRYVLYGSGTMATSDITSNLAADGTSTGLNAASADQTATVISNVLGIVTNIGSGVGASILPREIRPPQEPEKEMCTEKVKNALAVLRPPTGILSAKEKVKVAEDAVAAWTTKVSVLTALVQTGKGNSKLLDDAMKQKAAAQEQLNKDQESLDTNTKAVTDIQNLTWPLQAGQFRTDPPFSLALDVYKAWSTTPVEDLRRRFDVHLALYRQDAGGTWVEPAKPPTSDPKVGVPVRLPRTGRLLLCTGQPCAPTLASDWRAEEKNTKSMDQPVLQLGQLYTVPVRGGVFKSEKAVIAMDVNGLPTSVQVVESTAAMASISGALKEATEVPSKIREGVTKNINDQADQLKARSALDAASANAAVSSQTTVLQAQATLLQNSKALIDAATALAKSQGVSP
uniref:Uncharacterized protein n=1 Tax=Desulfovibrio sp. U5L TaxID=596152 RepID=I2PZ30_9BACT